MFLLCLFTMGTINLSAQSVQKGIVQEYHEKSAKTPLNNVAVSATNAGSTSTDAQGQFTLNFRSLKPGDNIQFRRIEKAGYEVMNREAVEVMRVGSQDNGKPLSIVLCRKTLLNELREGYRSVAVKHYDKQLKQAEAEIERLKTEGKIKDEEYNDRLDQIESEYETKLSNIDTYIDRFARIDIAELDEVESRIIALVKEGRFEEAMKLYEEQGFVEKLQKSKAELKELSEARQTIESAISSKEDEASRLRQSIERQINLLHLAGGVENINKVNEILHEVLLADETNIEARKNYANSLHQLRRNEEAFKVLNEGIALTSDNYDKAMLLGDIAIYNDYLGNYAESEKYALQTIDFSMPLKDKYPTVYSRILPSQSYILLKAYKSNGLLDKCPAIIQQMTENWKPDSLSMHSLNSYCKYLTELCDYYSMVADHSESIHSTEQTICLSEYYSSVYPWSCRIERTYADAASTYLLEGDFDHARKYAMTAIEKVNELVDKTPIYSFLFYSLNIYQTVITTLVDMQDYENAERVFNMLNERDIINKVKGSADAPTIEDEILIQLAEPQVKLYHGDTDAALRLITEIGKGVEETENQTEMLRHTDKGMVYQYLHDYVNAEKEYLQAIEYARLMNEDYQDAWSSDSYSRSIALYADLLGEMKKKSQCKKMLRKAESFATFEFDKIKINAIKTKYGIK